MVRTKQGGSILGFIVIGVTLVALLIGGVWAVRHVDFDGFASNNDTKVAQAPNDDDAATKGDRQTDDAPATTKTDDRTTPANEAEKSDSSEATPAPATDQPAADGTTADDDIVVTEMPQTGPAGMPGGLSVGLLIGAIAAYVASRRHAAGL